MKRIYSFLFVTMAMLMLSVSSAWAQYVKLTAEDGTESWIEIDGIINGTNIEIFKGRYESAIDRNTTGSIDLNEVWSLSGGEGTQYQVTNIGSFAFYECRGLTYVDIPSSVTSIREWAFSSCSGLTSVDIPSNVTSIEECAFSSCSGLTSVTMENGLTSIGHQAFDYCSGLTSIAIPSSVTSIGDGAFLHCSGLTSVTIPNSVTNIGGGAFSRCSGLTSIEIPSSVTNIGDYVFYECSGLTSIVIPSSVTSIGWYAFYGCSGMTSVTIPSSVTSIGWYAFYGCSGMTSVTIPSNVTSIGKYAFYGCSGLTSVTVPSSVTNIEDYAFCLCSGLTSVDIPFSVNSIGDYAFCRCSGLTSVDIPSNVTTIGKNAFYGCTGLTSVTIPSSVTSIEDYAFVGCSGLISIVVESGNSIYDSRNNCNAIIETSTNSLIVGSKNTKIPSSVTGIKKRAFRGCIGLTSMTIPNSVTSIEPGAFAGCIGLTSIVVELGNSVYDSRNNCNAIIETASNTLIAGCNNTVIPNSVTSIGEDAFWDYSGLTSIEIPSSVISIGFGAFYGCSGLTSVDIPNSVKRIGEDAFYGCSGLTSVTIPNSVTSIGYYAFKGCFGLTSVTIGNSLKSIGEDAFSGCNSLNKVIVNDIAAWCSINFDSWEANPLSKAHHLYSDENTEITNLIIPSSVKSIGENAFYDCSGLTSVEISNNVTSIGSSAFSGCSGLTSVTIGNSVKSIGDYAFRDCIGLTSITIGNSVKSIGRFAFSDCIGLISVTIPNSVTSIEYHAFSGCSCIVICNSKTPPTADDYTFNENMIAIVPDNLVSTYKNATGWKRMSFNSPCIAQRTTQTSITLYTSSLFSNVKAVLNGISFYPQADSIKITGLDPNTTYTISLSGDVGDIHLNSQMSVTTKNINLSIQLVKRTNLTLRLKGFVSDSDDAVIASSGFEDFEGQDEIYVQGLTPGMSYSYTYYVKAASGKKYTKTESFQTIPVDMNVNTSVCSSSAQLTGTYSVIDAIITECGFDGFQNQNSIKITGLDPNRKYNLTFYVVTKEGSKVTKQITYSTTPLTLTTSQPKVISAGNVIVAAETNLDNEETNVGFEWRRTDWTDDFTSNSGTAYLYNGTMEGYIRNLNTEKLWKYRPYYTSNAGYSYYGEWVGIDPTNTSYFEPTVHTYANVSVNGNSAEVKGYVQRGTDNVVSRGFAYWKQSEDVKAREAKEAAPSMISSLPSNAMTVEVSGSQQVMTTSISNLEYETTYCYVAFVKTAEGDTFYGEPREFTTDIDVTGIRDVNNENTVTVIQRYDQNGLRLSSPRRGLNILLMSDGSTKKIWVK